MTRKKFDKRKIRNDIKYNYRDLVEVHHNDGTIAYGLIIGLPKESTWMWRPQYLVQSIYDNSRYRRFDRVYYNKFYIKRIKKLPQLFL